jgi:hypothetical protein
LVQIGSVVSEKKIFEKFRRKWFNCNNINFILFLHLQNIQENKQAKMFTINFSVLEIRQYDMTAK